TLRRSPPGQHIALQPRVVPAGRLQRALGNGEFDALALQARIELIDAPFGLGPIGSGVDLDLGDAVGQRLYLLLGVGKRGLARFSVSARMLDRSVSDARVCSSSRVLASSPSRATVSRSTTFSVELRAIVASPALRSNTLMSSVRAASVWRTSASNFSAVAARERSASSRRFIA